MYLIDAFDNLVNGNDKLKKQLSPDYEFYYDEEKSFKNALKHDFKSNQERVMFHAYVRFLIQNKGNNSGIDQWMRVIHNLASIGLFPNYFLCFELESGHKRET